MLLRSALRPAGLEVSPTSCRALTLFSSGSGTIEVFVSPRKERLRMKLNRWIVLPAAGLAAVIVGVAAVEAAPSPSASPTSSKNYAQVFVDKLAGILHMTPAQTQDALKQAQLQTVDQMLADGKMTQAQADALLARVGGGLKPRFHKQEQAPGAQSPTTPTPTPNPSQSPAAYYSTI